MKRPSTMIMLGMIISSMLIVNSCALVSSNSYSLLSLSGIVPTLKWKLNGQKNIDIYDSRTLEVTFRQYSDTTTSAEVDVTSTGPVTVYPIHWVETMAPQDVVVFNITVTNSNPYSDTAGTITLICHDSYTTAETGRDSVNYVAKAMNASMSTSLRVYVLDSHSLSPITGVHVMCAFEDQVKESWTATDGMCTFSFGSMAPFVIVSTNETSEYYSTVSSTQLTLGDVNTMTLYVQSKIPITQSPSNNDWIWIVIIAVGVTILIIAIIAITRARNKKKQPPPPPPPPIPPRP